MATPRQTQLYGQGMYGLYRINPQQQAFNTFSDDWGQGMDYTPAQMNAINLSNTMPEGFNVNNMQYNPTVMSDGLVDNSNAGGLLGNLGGYLSAGSGLLQGLSGLAGAYTAYKGLELAKDQFAYQKGLANRNLANQAKIINNSYDNAGEVALGMIGSGSYNPTTDTQGSYGGMASQEVQDKYRQSAQAKHVNGSPV